MKRKLYIIVFTLLAVFIAIAAVLYFAGYYDISFIDRDSTVVTSPTDSSSSSSPISPAKSYELSVRSFRSQESLMNAAETQIADISTRFSSVGQLNTQGYYISDAVYSSDAFALARQTQSTALPAQFSFSTKTIPLIKKKAKDTGSYTTVISEQTVTRPALDLYMGYIISEDSGRFTLMDSSGKSLKTSLEIERFSFPYTRTKSGLPVFQIDEDYYIFNSETQDFEKIDSTEQNILPIAADLPSYYGSDTSFSARFYSENDRGFCEFYDSAGNVIFNSKNNDVRIEYTLPDTNGPESIGFYFFDDGYILVRRVQHYNTYSWRIIESDRTILLSPDGTQAEIPEDYTIVSYSNGVMLLEKNGFYGYMNTKGEWIAQPIYSFAQPFYEGLAVLGFQDGKIGMIDTEGNIVLPFAFDYISNCSGATITAFSDALGWQIFSKMKK